MTPDPHENFLLEIINRWEKLPPGENKDALQEICLAAKNMLKITREYDAIPDCDMHGHSAMSIIRIFYANNRLCGAWLEAGESGAEFMKEINELYATPTKEEK